MVEKLTGNSLRISIGVDDKALNITAATPLGYRERRFDDYPLVFDQLDAIWKQLEFSRRRGQILQSDTNDMLDDLIAIKSQYPKPD